MTVDPFQAFLNVPQGAGPAALLGLPALADVPLTVIQIEGALRERLEVVFHHPLGRTDAAEDVRRALRKAAEELKQQVQSGNALASARRTSAEPPYAAPVFNLTPFDRLVLAVLIASGGWNARSRARLVGLSSAYGVSVAGLIRVVVGLSRYGRGSAPQWRTQEIASSEMFNMSRTGPATPAILQRMTRDLSIELKQARPWTTVKLSMLFALATLALLVIGVWVLLTSSSTPPLVENSEPTPEPVITPVRPIVVPPAPPERQRFAVFPAAPTFLGNALPADSITASKQLSSIPLTLDDAVRKLAVEDEPSEAVYRNWDIDIETIASAWVLADATTRREIEQKIFEALREGGDRPIVTERLLQPLTPQTGLGVSLDIWRGTWKVHMLRRIARSDTSNPLPPVLIERAKSLAESAAGGTPSMDADASARRWLDSLLPQLVGMTEGSDANADFWELWLGAHRALGKGEAHDASIMAALHAMLATSVDLAKPGNSVNVVGRLLAVALESASEPVKTALVSWFDDEAITARDLWVLTSLIAKSDAARFFPDRLVLPQDADLRHRWRVRDELAAIWPESGQSSRAQAPSPVGRALVMDSALGAKWRAALEAAPPITNETESESLVKAIIRASRLNEAAEAMAQQENAAADRILNTLDEFTPVPQAMKTSPQLSPRTGSASGSGPASADGAWTAEYQQPNRTLEQRIELLRSLQNRDHDLGPIDAETFVREVYRGSPIDIRNTAQELVPRFARGPVVSMAMLDQFGDAPSSEPISRTIAAFTGQSLDLRSAGASAWVVSARLALVNHALGVVPLGRSDLDSTATVLLDSYISRSVRLRRDTSASMVALSIEEAARTLVNAWSEQVGSIIVANPVPDTLQNLQRRRSTRVRLAEGEVQKFVAHQLAILDLVAYIAAAEQPSRRDEIISTLRSAAELRGATTRVLRQSLAVEHAISRVWQIRMGLDSAMSKAPPAPVTSRENPSDDGINLQLMLSASAGWRERLEALDPSIAKGYFELAEDIADQDRSAAGQAMSQYLFALSAALDQRQFGRSACLALAFREQDETKRRKRLAIANLLGSAPLVPVVHTDLADSSAALLSKVQAAVPMFEALGHYRRGQGTKALEALRKPGALDLLRECENLLLSPSGGVDRILDDCKHYKGQARPLITPEQLVRMLRLEIALLSQGDRAWAADLLVTNHRPLIEVDPDRWTESLGVDVSRPYFRNGNWRAK